MAIHMDTPVIIDFGDSPRPAKKRSIVKLQWQVIIDVLGVCLFCKVFIITGDVPVMIPLHNVIHNTQELLQSKPVTCAIYSVFIQRFV